jgi:DNA-binding response OmpR family regulator
MAKVLVVEDDIDLCETYADALGAAGHTVYSVFTGNEAVDSLVHRRIVPDVVVLDLQLPGNSGIIILGVIRGMVRLRKTKVIIASGHPDTGQWAVAQWGADLFLQKPISLDKLKRTVDEFIASSASTKQPVQIAHTVAPTA